MFDFLELAHRQDKQPAALLCERRHGPGDRVRDVIVPGRPVVDRVPPTPRRASFEATELICCRASGGAMRTG